MITDSKGVSNCAVTFTICMSVAKLFEQLRIFFDGFAIAFFWPEFEILGHDSENRINNEAILPLIATYGLA